jgi:multiple sugar transport system permease protein
MRPPVPAARYILYALLGGASVFFLTPFVWMVITSLKPIEQAMVLPPTWVPWEYLARIDGERVEVTKDFALRQSGVVAEVTAGEQAGRRIFLSEAQVAAGAGEFRVLHRAAAGWWRVTEKPVAGTAARRAMSRWDIVPPAAIERRVRFRWNNYPEALAQMGGGNPDPAVAQDNRIRMGFWIFLGNSLTVCVLGVIGTVLSNAVVAYGFARLNWRGRDVFFALTLATMMVPFPVLMVPLYGVFKALGWIGTLQPLWVPAFFGSAFNIFLMRQFFRTIPEELSEAARIDGCSEWTIFWRIILPLSKPVLATAALFHFLYAWNDFMGPLLYLTRRNTYTLALALQSYASQGGGVQWPWLMAASAVTTMPIIVLFFVAQKTFIRGIATTGSKG